MGNRTERDFAEAFGVIRLDDIIRRAEADGFDDGRGLLAAREHDHLQLGARGLQRLQRLQAVHAGHRDVEQHDVGRLALTDRRDDLVAARVGARLVPTKRKKRPKIAGKPGVVIDHGDVCRPAIVGGAVRGF